MKTKIIEYPVLHITLDINTDDMLELEDWSREEWEQESEFERNGIIRSFAAEVAMDELRSGLSYTIEYREKKIDVDDDDDE